jgi:thymidine kinase
MNLNESLPTPDGEEKISFDEWLAKEKQANALSRKATHAKWARQRAEDMFDYHGGLIPWHETEEDRYVSVIARAASYNVPIYAATLSIDDRREYFELMIELFALKEDELSADAISMN